MRGKVFLLTGLSGAGKTTLATSVLQAIGASGGPGSGFVLLDGDALRCGLSSDLGFSPDARRENIRRAGEVAKLLSMQGYHVLMAFIAPYASVRLQLAQIIGQDFLRIVHVSCPLEVCISRDPKRNYQKALMGQMANYTGIADIYEVPERADLVLKTHEQSLQECTQSLLGLVRRETAA